MNLGGDPDAGASGEILSLRQAQNDVWVADFLSHLFLSHPERSERSRALGAYQAEAEF
jgi:hypothetical protein